LEGKTTQTASIEEQYEEKALEISLEIQSYDHNVPIPDPVILHPELHVKPCSICDHYGHKPVDCPEICPLCVKAGDCNKIRAGPQRKHHSQYITAQEDLPDFDDLTDIDHPHFSLILLNRLTKPIEKEVDLEN
jgi:hypothetical protein